MTEEINSSAILESEKKQIIDQLALADSDTLKVNNANLQVKEENKSQQVQQIASRTTFSKKTLNKKLSEVQKQKERLLRKLEYANLSISAIKQNQQIQMPSNSKLQPHELTLEEEKQFRAKHKEIIQRSKEEHKKIIQIKRQKEIKRKQKELKHSRQQKSKEEEQKSQKKKIIYENVKKIKERMEMRSESIKKQNETFQQLTHKKQLFQKLTDSFVQKQNSLLEERKKKLADIRSYHRPIDLHEIEQHDRKFLQMKKEREILRKRERRLVSSNSPDYSVSYKGSYYLKQTQKQKEEVENHAKIKAEKIKQFSMHIRQNFVPQINEQKKRYIDQIIQKDQSLKQKKQEQFSEEKRRVQEANYLGLKYLQEIKNQHKRSPDQSLIKKSPSGPQTERPKYHNYLTGRNRDGERSQNAWTKILNSGESKKDKAIKMHYEVQKYEANLVRKQQKARVLKADNSEEIDQEYFQMIQAKLDLLKI